MRIILLTFFLFVILGALKSQDLPVDPVLIDTTSVDTSDISFIKIISADKQVFDATGEQEKFISMGNVRITHDSVFMFCDTATIVNGSTLQAKGNISIIKNDTVRIFSDSLLYLSDSLMAYFVGNVVLEDGDQQLFTSFLQYDLEKDWAIYTDTALLITDGMEIKSKRGIFHVNDNYVNFYEKVTIEGEDFDLISDSLRFYTEMKRAVFLSPTLINQGEKKIYSEGGFYDIDDKESEFFGNAQFVEGDQISTADTIRNDDNTSITQLIGNAIYTSTDEIGKGNTIIYDKSKDEITLLGNAFFKNPENEVTGETILFNKKTEDVKVSGRSFLSNPPMIIVADDLDYNKSSGVAIAIGNVVWQDTSSNYEIICDHATYTDSTDYMKAYNLNGKPLLKNEVKEGDTMFLSGDTLISYSEILGSDTFRYFQAYEHVEMINSDMQAVCDSLSYNGQDSIFTLFKSPVMWSDSSQYSGDTIKILMKDDEIDRMKMLSNGMILMTTDFKFFDQIKGKDIDAIFSDGSINKMKVVGGSESVYYLKDDEEAYMGVNETKCTNMTFSFENGELIETRYYIEPLSKLWPMEKADHESLKLQGFKWLIEKRPLTVEDLYN